MPTALGRLSANVKVEGNKKNGVVMKPTFYALIVTDTDGTQKLSGAFANRRIAEAKGRELRTRYEVRPVFFD